MSYVRPSTPDQQVPPNDNSVDHTPFLGFMDEDEERATKEVIAKTVITSATYPLACVKTLIQLGHEPFPLTDGKTLIFCGRNAYFLPNSFSYAKQLAALHGFGVLFTGIDAALASLVLQGYTAYRVTKYIDQYYPEIGGKPENIGKEEFLLTDLESSRRTIRTAIRTAVVRAATIVVSRPLTVVAVRKIAQIIGGEAKYTNVFSSLRTIGVQEGPAGLFSGLVPALAGELLVVFGVHAIVYFTERSLMRAGVYDRSVDEEGRKEVTEIRRFINMAVPFFVNSWAYPYGVVSTVMAVAGSGLAVSFLPHSPSFVNWHDSYDYLNPHGLKRGARMFLREQTGAVTVGIDKQLYASNKHFA